MDWLKEMIAVVDSDFARGSESPEDVAKEWLDLGFAPSSARQWIETGRCFDASAAAKLRDIGLSPADVALGTTEAMGYYDSIGYVVANGDMSAERAKELLAADYQGI